MFCLAALIVLAIMGIFSATHRQLAKEAFDCVFRRVTLRPCETGFDTKMKAKILGSLINRSPKLAKVVSRRFELLSWIFIIITTVASVYSIISVYNFWAFGNCNGLNNSGGFCVFDPTGESEKLSGLNEECNVDPRRDDKLTLSQVDTSLFYKKGFDWGNRVVFMGCYGCAYTRKAYPEIKRLMEENATDMIFMHYPTKEPTNYLMAYDYCVYQQHEVVFWEYVDQLFKSEVEQVGDEEYVINLIGNLGLDTEAITGCVNSEETKQRVEKQLDEMEKTGIYGTPTVFVNDQALVGPKPYRVYKRFLNNQVIFPDQSDIAPPTNR